MSLISRRISPAAFVFVLFVAAIYFVTPPPAEASPILIIQVDTVYAYPGQQDVTFPIYLQNLTDTVAGFQLWMMLDQPDIMQFTGGFDTSGTLTSGWEFIDVRSVGGQGFDIRITGLANMVADPYTPGIGFPQTGDIPLIKIKANIYDIPDTTTDRYVVLFMVLGDVNNFHFSDEMGNLIGIYLDTVIDTNWYQCMQWMPPPDDTICLNWQQVSGPPADSIFVDTVIVPHLDTNLVEVIDGAMVIHPCGDANGTGKVNIQDITFLINFLYKSGLPPTPYQTGDSNGNGIVNIQDITYLINYLYKNGPAPQYQ
jgi:hypothetical protein